MAVRVHELAREFGVESKVILSTLKDMGEYVKSASSTVEAPVVRRLNEEHGDTLRQQGEKKAAKKAPAKKAAKAEPSDAPTAESAPEVAEAPAAPEVAEAPVVEPEPEPEVVIDAPAASVEAPAAEEAGTDEKPAAGPRPGPRTGGARPGNNPFSSRQGMQQERAPRPPASPEGGAPARPGMPRPNPAMMPRQSGLSGRPAARQGGPGGPGGRPSGPGGQGGGGGRGAP
ncbi:translation initiation factor IF-2 N-terminal domain-containing protein, partial [Aeromicrobium sp.]|uniref:translation initiation factor IF-2 N-terminal domain-containing protein n=1 Tax=Aeromicrobium sp. TaxID=1871063 RepID=UPI003C64F2A1